MKIGLFLGILYSKIEIYLVSNAMHLAMSKWRKGIESGWFNEHRNRYAA